MKNKDFQDKKQSPRLLISSFLEPEHVMKIRQVDPNLTVIYEPALLPVPRYVSDHVGNIIPRSEEDEQVWRSYLARAEILFSFDYTNLDTLPDLAPNVRWLQATSAGIGQFIRRIGYDKRMPNTIFTTASGVHSRPLAEFVIMVMLMHYKQQRRVVEDQIRGHWQRYAGTDLEGRTLGILGLGHNGSEVARMTKSLGMHVIGSDLIDRRDVVDVYYPASRWREMLPQLDVLVLTVPHTGDTQKILGRAELGLIKDEAYLINIARGAVVDEQALIDAINSGKLSGAALDVFEQEPLPVENSLWDMQNVLVSPHSASTSDRENQRLTDLFCDNLQRYLSGQPLRNVLDTQLLY